jgi:ATP-dependent Clp protease ATP-binding subunit ClpB
MRMDKLTSRFQQAMADAQSLAVGRDHTMIEPAHLLLALLDQQGGSTARCWRRPASTCRCCASAWARRSTSCPRSPARPATCQVGNDLVRLLNVTDKLAQQRGDAYIASELFLLAALDDKARPARR